MEYYRNLDRLLAQADHLSQQLQIEIQKSQARFQQLLGLREQMAKYIVAAQEFLNEYPAFIKNQHPLDNFAERLSKKLIHYKCYRQVMILPLHKYVFHSSFLFSL